MSHQLMLAGVRPRGGGLWIFVLGLMTGLAMVYIVFDTQTFVRDRFDPYFFGEMGKSLARGEGFDRYGVLLMRRAPLYPMTIGGLFLLFGEHPRVVQWVQCLLLAGTCWLVFDMGRRVFNKRTGIIAGAMCALHPMMLRYVADLHLETLLTFLFTLTVWCTLRFYETPTRSSGAWLGFVGAAASLTKAVVVLYPALFICVWLAIRIRDKHRGAHDRLPWGAVAGVFVAMALVILPWTARNYRATHGHFVLISSGFSDAFLRGYIFSEVDYALLRKPPYTDAENACNAWFRRLCRAAGTEWQKDDYETEQILARAAKEKLIAEPGEFVRKFSVGLFTFWYQMTSLANSVVTGVMALAAWALAAFGWNRGFREGRPVWLFVLPALYLNVLLAALLALGRYSAPVLPALLVASAYGVDALLSKAHATRARVVRRSATSATPA
jgi:4-amino-4-deoxy-L-arabinose transferase-like glycosyltransferase